MKKISKILSSVLAASLALSCMAMNVMAASKAHTVTITPDKAEGLKAGDTLTIELTVDNTENLCAFDYILTFDASAFAADTVKVSRLEKCIDKTWMDGIKDTDGDWGYYLGSPTYKVNADNMNFAWAGAEGVEAEYAIDNRVVGKFYLTVKEDVADGEYTFALTGSSTDAGETLGTALTCESVTVKVGEDKPEEPVAQSVQTTVFEPAVGDYVEITLTDAEGTQKGDSVKFSLPENVKGKAKVLGFLKYKIGVAGEGREAPAAGDILTAVLMNLTEGAKATIVTETVK